jgi:hypothetical protein
MRSVTTRGLLAQIRSLLDENNEAEISDSEDLMPALNRAFDDALDILARKYPDSIIASQVVPIVPGQAMYDIPKDAYQERLEKVEAFVNGFYTEIKRIAYNDITAYDVPSSGTPYYYAVMGAQYKLAPPPRNINGIRIWYIPERGPLVEEYGRVSSINTQLGNGTKKTNVSLTQGLLIIPMASTSGISVGSTVGVTVTGSESPVIPWGTTVTQVITDTSITLSAAPTATVTKDLIFNGQNYVVVTDVADPTQVSNGIDSLASFVNLIDNRSGLIKATLQVQSIDNFKLTFKSIPSRTTVQGRTVVGQLPASVERDDYLCPVDGTCIPPMRSPLTNFLISYTVADIKAIKLDGDPQVVIKMLDKFEQRVERTWVRREQELRVGKASRIWGPRARNFWSRTPSS